MQGDQSVQFYHYNNNYGSSSGRSIGPDKRWELGTEKEEGLTNFRKSFFFFGSPNGTRTRVFGVRGRYPRPLDDGTAMLNYTLLVIGY